MSLETIVREAMVAVGMSDNDDPNELPDRIREVRFIGNTYVPNGEYPRNGAEKASKVKSGRRKGIGYIGNVA